MIRKKGILPFSTILYVVIILITGCFSNNQGHKAPTESQVREAVDNYFSDDEHSGIAKENLKSWGNQALPHLIKFANKENNKSEQYHLVISLAKIGTKESDEILMDILDGKTNIDPVNVINTFFQKTFREDNRKALQNNPRFKKAVFLLASHETDWYVRSVAADIMGRLAWKDSLTLLNEMLQDKVLSVRVSAARSIELIAGEKVEIKRPKIEFPEMKADAHILKEIGTLEEGGWMSSAMAFTRWFNGRRGIVRWYNGKLFFHDSELKELKSVGVQKMCHEFVMIHEKDTTPQLVSLVSDGRRPIGGYVESFDQNGRALWHFKPMRSGVECIAPLYNNKGGETGVVIGVGGSEGIVALDNNGKKIWRIPDYCVLYDLKVNPALPDRIVACGGTIDVFDSTGKSVLTNSSRKESIYTSHIEVFKDDSDRMAIIAVGTTKNAESQVVRYNDSLVPVWKASLSHDSKGLAMVEADNGKKVFVIADTTGRLIIFDQHGTMLCQRALPEKGKNNPVIFDIAAGQTGENKYAFCVATLAGLYFYELIL